MSRLSQKASDKEKEITDLDEDIQTYCIIEQISEPNTISKKRRQGRAAAPD